MPTTKITIPAKLLNELNLRGINISSVCEKALTRAVKKHQRDYDKRQEIKRSIHDALTDAGGKMTAYQILNKINKRFGYSLSRSKLPLIGMLLAELEEDLKVIRAGLDEENKVLWRKINIVEAIAKIDE